MSPALALLLCIGVIIWLLRTDHRQIRGSRALLIPALWFMFVSSRSPEAWLAGSAVAGADATADGGPMNLVVYFGLMLAATAVLRRRGFYWSSLFRSNRVLIIMYLYFALSSAWSPIHFTALKRIIKDFGTVLSVLVILTETDPFGAARLMFARCSFVLFPLSICFIKYFPSLGRMYSKSWEPMNNGVTTHKNSLGALTMVLLLMLAVDIIELRRQREPARPKLSLRLRYAAAAMGLWLLFVSQSRTSLIAVIVGLAALWAGIRASRAAHPVRILLATMGLIGFLGTLQATFDIEGAMLHLLGRNATLTGRSAIWEMIGQQHINPICGCGYLTFWDSPAAQAYRTAGGTDIVSTHNGYLEMYVDGGSLAELLLLALLATGLVNILRQVRSADSLQLARLMYLVPILAYNWSESAYYRLGAVWFVSVFVLLDYRRLVTAASSERGTHFAKSEPRLVAALAGPTA